MIDKQNISISIITVVLNQADFIKNCVQSVLTQTYPYIEYIIIDGGSNDGTLEIIEEYRSRISTIISEKDGGIYEAMNKGLQIASGDIVGFLNADDFYAYKDVIKTVAATFTEENTDSCYGEILYVNRSDTSKIIRYWRSQQFSKKLMLKGWFPPHTAFFIKREAVMKYGGFDLSLKFAADVEFMIRMLLKHHISSRYVPQVFVKMRYGGKSNRSVTNILKSIYECYKGMIINEINVTPLYMLKTFIFRIKQLNQN